MILLTKVFITNILHWHFTYLLELCTQPLRPHSSTIWGHSKLPTPVILLVTIPAMAAHWHYTTLHYPETKYVLLGLGDLPLSFIFSPKQCHYPTVFLLPHSAWLALTPHSSELGVFFMIFFLVIPCYGSTWSQPNKWY